MRKANKNIGIYHLASDLALRVLLAGCVLLALFLVQPQALAKPRIVALPYRSVNGLILIEAKANGNPVTLVMDTGANHTIIDAKSCGYTPTPGIDVITSGVGISGNALRLRVDVELGKQFVFSQPVSVMNLDELSHRLGTPFDGLLGQDILRQFRSIRINYKRHVIELQD